jgi:hypothetical protein
MDVVQLLCTACAAAVTNSLSAYETTEALDRLVGHNHTDKSVSECTLHVRARARVR